MHIFSQPFFVCSAWKILPGSFYSRKLAFLLVPAELAFLLYGHFSPATQAPRWDTNDWPPESMWPNDQQCPWPNPRESGNMKGNMNWFHEISWTAVFHIFKVCTGGISGGKKFRYPSFKNSYETIMTLWRILTKYFLIHKDLARRYDPWGMLLIVRPQGAISRSTKYAWKIGVQEILWN